jgi:hypothetical protein
MWARWFLESLCDPERFVVSYPGYAELFAQVLEPVERLLAEYPRDERVEFARLVARLLDSEVQRRQSERRLRERIDWDTKQALWEQYGPRARCYICGYEFEAPAVSAFLGTVTRLGVSRCHRMLTSSNPGDSTPATSASRLSTLYPLRAAAAAASRI